MSSVERSKPKIVARVIAEHRTNFTIRADGVEYTATVRGAFHSDGTFPKVGDYVECVETSPGIAVIETILPRKTIIVRDATERRRQNSAVVKQQIIVTNIDVIFIVMGLDGDFNPRRLERYLLLAQKSNISPVVILNKSDVVEDASIQRSAAAAVAGDVPIHLVSARTGNGMQVFREHIGPETTAVLLGSSGAGKSTITNWLLGDETQSTGSVRESDGRGKHTTTSKELFELPLGGYLIDTPGMRELGTIADAHELANVFAHIEALALQCTFPDCDHDKSEGCAIQSAVASGKIDAKQFRSYLKLQREQHLHVLKTDHSSYVEHKKNLKRRHKEFNKTLKQKHKSDTGSEF